LKKEDNHTPNKAVVVDFSKRCMKTCLENHHHRHHLDNIYEKRKKESMSMETKMKMYHN